MRVGYDLEFQSKEVNLSVCQLKLATSWQTLQYSCQTSRFVVKLSIMVGKLVTENIFQTGESRIKLVIKTPFLKKIFKNLNFNLQILGFPSILIVEKE